jgi:hypothetical protein
VRYSDLVKFRAVDPETQPFVESGGRHLRVQVHLGESLPGGQIHEATHHGDAGSAAAVLRQHCDAANLTGGFQASSADGVTVCGSRALENQHVSGLTVLIIPFVAFIDLLFLDENSPSHVLDLHAVVRPRGERDDVVRG